MNLRYVRAGQAKNADNAKGMLFPMYGVFCLITFSHVHDSEF